MRFAHSRRSRLCHAALVVMFTIAMIPSTATGFPHIAQEGETLSSIAEHIYGRVELEQVLVVANDLGGLSGDKLVSGMRLEIPSVDHYRVVGGDSWQSLAARFLGSADRAETLAAANQSNAWIPPGEGLEVLIPYNLRYVAAAGDSIPTLAYRFLGVRDKAALLSAYNHLKHGALKRGDVILIPLADLPITPHGRAEAERAAATARTDASERTREAQRGAESVLPEMALHIHSGRYVDVVSAGNRLLGSGRLARAQIAQVERYLTEAYAALGAFGLAESACVAWRDAAPDMLLDPVEMSPKMIRACTQVDAARLPVSPAASSDVRAKK